MNVKGNPGTLVAAHPGNTNAVRYGVYSSRFIEPRAAEIVAQITESVKLSAVELIAVEQVARCTAILENIDRDLSERGVTDKRGHSRSLLNHRSRISRSLDRWLAQVAAAMERQAAAGHPEGVADHAVAAADEAADTSRLGQAPPGWTGEVEGERVGPTGGAA